MKLLVSKNWEKSAASQPSEAVDGDGGVQGGLGHADLSGLGRHLPLGAADVGAPAKQVRRNARGDPGRRVRHRVAAQLGSRAQLRLQVAWRHAEQRAECVVGLTERDLKRRDGRTGLLQDGPRLLHVKPGRGADPEFLLGKGQDSLLNPDVVARDLDPLLGDPILHVVRGHVRQQGHQGRVVVFHRSIEAGIVRLDVPADAAPQVELPAQVEAVEPVGERERP